MSEQSRTLSVFLSAVLVLAVTSWPLTAGALWLAHWYLAQQDRVLALSATDYYGTAIIVSFVVLIGNLGATKAVEWLHTVLELLPGDADKNEPEQGDGGGGTPLPQAT